MGVVAVVLVGALVAVLLAVLLVPVRIQLRWVQREDTLEPRWQVQTRWLFVTWRSGVGARRREQPRPDRRPRRAGPSSGRRARAMVGVPGLLRRTTRLALDLARAAVPRTVRGWIRFGLDDPTSTAILCGPMYAAAAVTRGRGWALDLEPDFAMSGLCGDVRADWVVRPGRLVLPIVSFACSPVVWRAGLAAMRAR